MKVLLLMLMVIALSFGFAQNGNRANVSCTDSLGNELGNPAAMFKYWSERGNPRDVVDSESYLDTVGGWVQLRCSAGNP